MLHPDYSDAEIRREVRNFGVTKSADGSSRWKRRARSTTRWWLDGQRQLAGWRAENHALYGTRTRCHTTRAASRPRSAR